MLWPDDSGRVFSLATLVYATAAGVGVVLATSIGRRMPGPLGGIVAAAPITPSAAFLLLTEAWGEVDLVAGLPSVVATLVVMALAAGVPVGWRRVPLALLIVVFVPWLALSLRALAPTLVVVVLVPVAAWVAWVQIARMGPASTQRAAGGLSVPLRFAVGAGVILLVAWIANVAAPLAPLLALFPLLFTANLVAAQLDGGGPAAWRMARGGVPGSVGVAAFAVAVAAGGMVDMPMAWRLVFGWLMFALGAGVWALHPGRIQVGGWPWPSPWFRGGTPGPRR